MTVSSTKNTVTATLTGNAAETVTIDYLFFANADLAVYVEDQTTKVITVLTLDTDYSITGAGVSTGGTLTIITTQTSGDKILIDRWLDPLQETDYIETGKFPALSHETALDRLTMMVQQALGRMGGVTHDPGFTEFMSRSSTNITQWDAKTSIITAVSTPTANTHAANKSYVDGAINGAGDVVAPANPSEDTYILVASGGTFTWQNFRVPSPVSADDERLLEVTGTGAGGFTFADLGRRNYLINGGFRVNQRGGTYTAASFVANNDDNYLVDRWVLLSNGNDVVDVSVTTETEPPAPTGAYGFLHSLVATANLKWGFLQILEARDAIPLVGQTVSLSFDVRGTSEIDNVRASIISWTGNADAVTSDVVNVWGATGTNPTYVTSWALESPTPTNIAVTTSFVRQKIEGVAIDRDTANTKNIAVFIWVDDTTISTAQTLDIANVQLELSSTAHAFVPRHIQEELTLCQRYYTKTFTQATAPAQNTGTAAMLHTLAITNGSFDIQWSFPTTMRVAPTITLYNPAAANNDARNFSDNTDTNAEADLIGDSHCRIQDVSLDATDADNVMGIHASADAEL